ncbi:MAG: TlpA family protein disulfide reductase [Candidatus Paceibacteria bacterium]
MQKAIVGFVVAGVVLTGGWYVLSMGKTDDAAMMAEKAAMEKATMEEKAMMEQKAMDEKMMMEKDGEMMNDDMNKAEAMSREEVMMKKEDQAMSGDEAMKKVGEYAPYEVSKLAMANTGDVVLFFKASWCPSCRALDGNIKANLEAIPAGLTILEVDYDNSAAMKQQYGVTTQHTLVQVDASGKLIKKWSGGSTLASIVAQVQ